MRAQGLGFGVLDLVRGGANAHQAKFGLEDVEAVASGGRAVVHNQLLHDVPDAGGGEGDRGWGWRSEGGWETLPSPHLF